MPNNKFLAAAGPVTLTADDFLQSLHLQRRLPALLLDALSEKIILTEAEKAGLTVSDDELQQAADDFRHRHGLGRAAAMHQWLAEQSLTPAHFQMALERELLTDKFITHVTKDGIERHFDSKRSEYDRLRLRLILVAREDLARELLAQIQEEGADFAELATEHSAHESRRDGGLFGTVARRELAQPVAKALADAQTGDVVGPVAMADGFQLFLVEALVPAELNATVRRQIRDELFDLWLDRYFQRNPVTLPIVGRI